MARRGRTLFLSLTNDVGSDRVVSEVGRNGGACAVIGSPGSYAGLVRCVSARFDLPARLGPFASSFVLRRRLEDAVLSWRPEQIVPLDEFAALLLRTIGVERRTPPATRALIVRSLGKPEGFNAACHRLPLMHIAVRAGVRTPEFRGITDLETADSEAGDLGFPLLIKRDHSSGSAGVVTVENRTDLGRELRNACLKTAVKRVMANVAGFERDIAPTLIQAFVPGQLAMRTVACRDGEVIDGASFAAVVAHPATKASTILRHVDHAEMNDAARKVVAALGCSGFVSFDFILDDRDRAFLIEMNARPIGSTHLGRLFGHDLVKAFLSGSVLPEHSPELSDADTVALFPKELERDPMGTSIAEGRVTIHDLPRTETAVLAAYVAHLEALHPKHIADFGRHIGLPDRPSGVRNLAVVGSRELC